MILDFIQNLQWVSSLIVFSTKINLPYPLYSTVWRCYLLHLIKQLFKKNHSTNYTLNDLGISLPVFLFKTSMKLHNITPKMVKNVTMNLDSSKESGPDCIPLVVLKKFRPEPLCILVELFKFVWKNLVFQIVGRSRWWSLDLRMLGKGLLLKTTVLLIFFLWLVKSLKKLINNRIFDHLEKCRLFSDFQYGFRSF